MVPYQVSMRVEFVCSSHMILSFQYHCAAASTMIMSNQSFANNSYVNPPVVSLIVTKNMIGAINQKISKKSIRFTSKTVPIPSAIVTNLHIITIAITLGINIPISMLSSNPTTTRDRQLLVLLTIYRYEVVDYYHKTFHHASHHS